MLKTTETEKQLTFLSHFYDWYPFNWKSLGPLTNAYDEKNKFLPVP